MSTKKSMGIQQTRGKPRDLAALQDMPGRTFGLGRQPVGGPDGTLAGTPDAMSANANAWDKTTCCPVTQQQVIEYNTWTVPLALTDTAVESTFGNEIQLLQGPTIPAGVAAIDSSFAMGGLLQSNMYCTSIGFHIFGSPMAFSTLVNWIAGDSVVDGAPTVSPDVFSASDLAHGGMGPTSGIFAGVFEYGVCDWNAGYHMSQAYQINWKFCNRYLLLNEMLSDFAYFGPGADGQGFGNSEIPIAEYIQKQNDQIYGPLTGQYMLPVQQRRYSSVNSSTTGISFATNVPVWKITNDFKMAEVAYGGIGFQQRTSCTPYRKLGRPVYLRAGLPIVLNLLAQDQYEQTEFQRYLSISNGAGNNLVANVEIASGVISGTQAGYASAVAGLELTLDQGTSQFAQQFVDTDTRLGKGGELKFSALFKGFECCDAWQSVFNNPANYAQLSQNVYMPGMSGVPVGR